MKTPFHEIVKRYAKEIAKKDDPVLDEKDKTILKHDGARFMRQVQTNIKLNKKPLSDIDDTGKKVLLAYVVFLRQNITTSKGDKPNEEDAAKILHGEIYNDGEKEEESLEEQLLKQLSKIGVEVDKKDDKE